MSFPSYIKTDKTLEQILEKKQPVLYESLYNHFEMPHIVCPAYKSYLFTNEGRERINSYVKIAISSIKGNPKPFFDDQKTTARTRACQGFALQGVLNVASILEKAIWENIINKQCELLNKKSVFAVLNKSLLFSQYMAQTRTIIVLSFNEVITNKVYSNAEINNISLPPYFDRLIETVSSEFFLDKIGSTHHQSSYMLTSNEKRVLELVCEGYKNNEIAKTLHLSVDTVKYYIKNILQKLNAVDRTQAVTIAFRIGLLK